MRDRSVPMCALKVDQNIFFTSDNVLIATKKGLEIRKEIISREWGYV